MAKTEQAPRPARCLLVLPANLADGLAMRGLVSSVAGTGRQLVTITRGAQAAVLDPTLLALRLQHTPEHLDAPLSLERREVADARLRSLACDEAIVLDRSWWVLRARSVGIARRAAPGGFFGAFATKRLPATREPAADTARAWVASLGIPWRSMPTVHVPGAWRRLGRERLVKAKVDLDAPKVGVYRGTGGGRGGGAWPDDRFEELVRQLRRRRPQTQVVIFSTDHRRDLWKSVQLYEKTGKIHPVIGPELHDDGLAAVLHQLDYFIAADCAMLHIAAAAGTPTLGLYERRALDRGPRAERAETMQKTPLAKLGVDEVVRRVLENL